MLQAPITDWPIGLLGMSVPGLMGVVGISCAFFPPGFYRRWVEAHSTTASD